MTGYEHHDERAPISVYTVGRDGRLVSLADTTEEGIAMTLRTLREDGDLSDRSAVGIRDRARGIWLAHPYARAGR